MNRTIKLVLLIIVIVVVISVIFYFLPKKSTQNNLSITATSIQEIKIPVTVFPVNQLRSFGNIKPISFFNESNKVIVSLLGVVSESRNPGSNLYVNDKKIGQVAGQSIESEFFSENNKYFALRTMSICGANCSSFNLYVVNLLNQQVTNIPFPRKKLEYTGNTSQYQDKVAQPFIESYSFDGDDLKIIFFFIGIDENDGKTYRISPKEIWKYDLATGQYTLVNIIPETE